MPGILSNTGLMTARINPVYKRKPKKIDLLGIAKPAPFILRPFAGLFNPFPYGCSVLCNHPADCEAKEFVRRAKESWATEGKALLLPAEMEMIRASLRAGGVTDSGATNDTNHDINTTTTVPEELFRKYTETDSRPLTPTPTLASGTLTVPRGEEDLTATCNPRERTTLILDLRTSSQEQENETLSWHALTLEPPPSPARRNSDFPKPPIRHQRQQCRVVAQPTPVINISDENSSKNDDADENSESVVEMPMRRRGKRLKKRKCRRGSTYGQQNEVRDPLDPPETQVSQVDDTSRRNSAQVLQQDNGELTNSPEKTVTPVTEAAIVTSFISPEILLHLARELDRDTIEEEFCLRRKIALEEAFRVKSESHPNIRSSFRATNVTTASTNAPRIFSRQNARFELLDSASLATMTPLQYLGEHVSLPTGRKLVFARTFNKYYEDTLDGRRFISPNDLFTALEEVMGKPFTDEQMTRFNEFIGEIKEPVNFRTWCGVCAVCERLLSFLPPREVDPPTWIERADFEALERRLKGIKVDEKLIYLLRAIRDQ